MKKYTAWNSTLRPGKPPERKKRLNPFGRVRRRREARGEVNGFLCRAAREAPCAITGALPDPENHPHHVIGGNPRRDWIDGRGNVLPLAPAVHRDWHRLGETRFAEKYGWTKDDMIRTAAEWAQPLQDFAAWAGRRICAVLDEAKRQDAP